MKNSTCNNNAKRSHDGGGNRNRTGTGTGTYTLTEEDEIKNSLESTKKHSSATTAAVLQLLNLKPLRDLARNFDIDIATCLNDYLNELDPEELSPSNLQATTSSTSSTSQPLPNFAQAALLLQNSSCVYSRKVEYLHSLVYQTLHSLIEQTTLSKHKKNSNNGKAGQEGGRNSKNRVDDDICYFQEYDSDLQFLLLDDILPVDTNGTRINMKESAVMSEKESMREAMVSNSIAAGGSGGSSESVANSSTVLNTTRLSIGLVIDDQLDSNAGTDATENTMSTTLRLMNGICHINSATGALLMPGTTTEVATVDSVFQRQKNNDNFDPNDMNGEGIDEMDFAMEKDIIDENANQDNSGIVFDGDYDNDDNDGNGFDLHMDEIEYHNKLEAEKHKNVKNTKSSETLEDPWILMLDPHDNSDSKVRPMKFGKTIRLPKDCDELPSDYVTGAGSKRPRSKINDGNEPETNIEDRHEWYNKECIATHSYNAMIRNVKMDLLSQKRRESHSIEEDDSEEDSLNRCSSYSVNILPLTGHLFGNEFQYIAKVHHEFKAAQRRKARAQLRRNNDTHQRDTVIASVEASLTNERFREMYEDEDDDGFVDFNGDSGDYDDDDNDDAAGGNVYDDNNGGGGESQFRDFDKAFTYYNGDNNSSDGKASFEELCRLHLQEFAKDAANYAVETGLTKRVSDWQSKLAMILENEDARPEFNITSYSNKILAALDQKNKKVKNNLSDDKKSNAVNFASVTKHMEPYDVSRTFLSSLMLCNSENVVFDNGGHNDVSQPDSLQIKLLKLSIHSPMENYLAPSLSSQ